MYTWCFAADGPLSKPNFHTCCCFIYCSKHDILKEYLEIHGSEVLNMILTEWNTEDAIAYAREEGIGIGETKLRNEILDLLEQGLSVDQIKVHLEKKSDN